MVDAASPNALLRHGFTKNVIEGYQANRMAWMLLRSLAVVAQELAAMWGRRFRLPRTFSAPF
jgi:hypothetical protein